jgi:CheY-like chemotaxis protein
MKSPAPTRILVVENDSGVRTTVAMILRVNGYEVETANDGFDALTCLRSRVPDIILSDLNMPEMSGFELLSVIRRRFPQVKVIATSGAYNAYSVPSGVLADGFYGKGRSSAAELLEVVKKVVEMGPVEHDRASAPVWIPRNGRDHRGKPFVVLNCTECLRSFPFSVEGEPTGEILTTPCLYCPHEISYIIDFSRSVSSPEKRVAWRASFLQSQQGKIHAKEAADAKTLTAPNKEKDKKAVLAASRPFIPRLAAG